MNRTGLALTALVVAVVLAFATAQAATPSLPTGAGGADITQYMPKNSSILVSINVSKLANTGIFDTLKQMAGEEAFAELTALGIDPAKDIKQLMVGVVVDRENPENDPAVYMALSGNFPPASKFIEAYKAAEESDPETREVGGKTIYTMDDMDWCFLDGVVLLVPLEADADVAQMLGGVKESVVQNVELTGLMKNVNTQATVWGIASLPEELRAVMAEDGENAPFDVKTLQTISGSFDYAEKVAADVVFGFTGEEGPQGLVTYWDTNVKPTAETMGQQIPAIATLIAACEMKASGKAATFKFSMAQADFDAAIKGMVQMMFGAMVPVENGAEVENGGDEGTTEDDTNGDDNGDGANEEW